MVVFYQFISSFICVLYTFKLQSFAGVAFWVGSLLPTSEHNVSRSITKRMVLLYQVECFKREILGFILHVVIWR
jgi:hypothetical protein